MQLLKESNRKQGANEQPFNSDRFQIVLQDAGAGLATNLHNRRQTADTLHGRSFSSKMKILYKPPKPEVLQPISTPKIIVKKIKVKKPKIRLVKGFFGDLRKADLARTQSTLDPGQFKESVKYFLAQGDAQKKRKYNHEIRKISLKNDMKFNEPTDADLNLDEVKFTKSLFKITSKFKADLLRRSASVDGIGSHIPYPLENWETGNTA